jgi:hypothetical protein
MASLALGAAGAGIGGAIGGVAGAQLGFSIGVTLAGVLFPPKQEGQEKGKLDDLRVTGSSYGQLIPQVYGRGAVGGNVIWSTDLQEHSSTTKKAAKGTPKITSKNYTYTISMAVLLCEGPVGKVNRIWAEDRLIYDNGDATTDEIQQISVGSNSGGFFHFTFRGDTSFDLAWNETTANVANALDSLPSIGTGNYSLSGPDGGPWQVTFTGDLAGLNVERMDMSNGTLTGGSGEGITTVQQGGVHLDITIYLGTEDQEPDPRMELEIGSGLVPAHRGLCYFVIEDFDLGPWGNRPPVFKAEVMPV